LKTDNRAIHYALAYYASPKFPGLKIDSVGLDMNAAFRVVPEHVKKDISPSWRCGIKR
jgi:hypothetical protein